MRLRKAQPPTHPGAGDLEPEPLRPDVIIGLKDWECMQVLLYSDWGALLAADNEKQGKWHMHMFLLTGQRTCLRVYKTISRSRQK
jgi:hypothetical protein